METPETNENVINKQGVCYSCPYWSAYDNYCSYYHIILNSQGYEATCRNPERIIRTPITEIKNE